jgi:hypothetical protein
MTARLSLLFALALGWAGVAQAGSQDRAPDTQTRLAGIHAPVVACGTGGDKKDPP